MRVKISHKHWFCKRRAMQLPSPTEVCDLRNIRQESNRLYMPTKQAIKRAQRDKQQGKSASTQAGEFVKDEIDKVRKGEHGVRNTKQAIAIGLSEARRAGVKLKPPKAGTTSEKTRKQAERELKQGAKHKPVSAKRSRARVKALKREGTGAVSHEALSRQAHTAASRRSATNRSAAAKKAAVTKGPRKRSQAAKKAARTRARAGH